MKKYKGKLVHTITEADIGSRNIKKPCNSCGYVEQIGVTVLMGRIFPADVGKRIYKVGRIFQVENQDQLQDRLAGL